MIHIYRIFCLVFLTATTQWTVLGQDVITGEVYSKGDSTAIIGASVYLDGTSKGVSTYDMGKFRIEIVPGTTTPLIISSLGFKPYIITNLEEMRGENNIIFLEESLDALEEVFLETDPWSRQKKLGIFKREFLGINPAALQCIIKNPEVLTLTYIPSRAVLTARAREPLVIVNRYLGYEISYDLQDFIIEFSTGTSGLQLTHTVYFEGYSLFKELKKRPSKKIIKNRERAYQGSSLHFMRSLASTTLHENKFRIFYNSWEVLPYQFLSITPMENLFKIEIFKEKLVILHAEINQSTLYNNGIFYIDHTGNHTPAQNVIFSGEMGSGRISKLLPLNYAP